jgi:hypothetical protein
VADVKKKWTNIKDSFVKDVKGNKPRKSRGPPEHRKKYYLFDHLQFLIPFIQDTKGTAAGSGRTAADGTEEPKKKKTRKTTGSSRTHGGTTVGAPEQIAVKPEMPADVQQHVDALNGVAGKSAADAMCQLDGDLSFMVSLLPTVKSLNEKQKINFKIGVLQLLARIKFNEVVMQQQQQQYPASDAAAAAAAAAAAVYQPFVAPDLRCFPVPYQPSIPFPFINHHQAAVSSTQQQHGVHQTAAASCSSTAAAARSMKHESSPQTSSFFDTDDGGPEYDSDDN